MISVFSTRTSHSGHSTGSSITSVTGLTSQLVTTKVLGEGPEARDQNLGFQGWPDYQVLCDLTRETSAPRDSKLASWFSWRGEKRVFLPKNAVTPRLFGNGKARSGKRNPWFSSWAGLGGLQHGFPTEEGPLSCAGSWQGSQRHVETLQQGLGGSRAGNQSQEGSVGP